MSWSLAIRTTRPGPISTSIAPASQPSNSDVAVVGHEIQDERHCAEEPGVDSDFDGSGFRSKAAVHASEGPGQTLEVVVISGGHDVDVGGRERRTVDRRGEASDEHEPDAFFLQDGADDSGVEGHRPWRGVPVWVRISLHTATVATSRSTRSAGESARSSRIC
jgi:hypothetical protein